jgi:hypothetical protein
MPVWHLSVPIIVGVEICHSTYTRRSKCVILASFSAIILELGHVMYVYGMRASIFDLSKCAILASVSTITVESEHVI